MTAATTGFTSSALDSKFLPQETGIVETVQRTKLSLLFCFTVVHYCFAVFFFAVLNTFIYGSERGVI